MKVLIVSFDRSLVKQLKNVLSEYEVVDVKNGEEALGLITTHFDVIIYDAISGALSEEDINNMYQQKFKDAKFVVLVDDLFPINAQNLKPQKKILIPRESTPDQILSAITAPVQKTEEHQSPTLELEIETHRQTVEELEKVIEIAPSEQKSIEALLFEKGLKPTEVQPESKEGFSQYISESVHPKKRVAVVSFDSTLVDSITSLLSENFEPVVIRSFRNLESLLKDVDGVIFDAISGLAAKKRLMELAKDQYIAQKSFLVLVDELFNINMDDVPLRNMHLISREKDPKEIVEKFKEIIVPLKEEETTLIQMFGELIEKQEVVQEKEKDVEVEEFPQIIKEFELPKLEEDLLPMEEFAFEEQKEEPTITPQMPIQEAVPTVSALEHKTEEKDVLKSLSIRQVIEETIKEEVKRAFEGFTPSDLARELLREELKKDIGSMLKEEIRRAFEGFNLNDLVKELLTEELKKDIRSVLKEEVKRAFEGFTPSDLARELLREELKKDIGSIPLESIIREITYQVLRERLRELIT
jgi:DNA-binding NarL/FixJ family response regulator/ribosomal protein S3AE